MRTNICAIKNNVEKHVIIFIYRLYIYNHNRGTCVNKTRKFYTYKLKENKNNDRNKRIETVINLRIKVDDDRRTTELKL